MQYAFPNPKIVEDGIFPSTFIGALRLAFENSKLNRIIEEHSTNRDTSGNTTCNQSLLRFMETNLSALADELRAEPDSWDVTVEMSLLMVSVNLLSISLKDSLDSGDIDTARIRFKAFHHACRFIQCFVGIPFSENVLSTLDKGLPSPTQMTCPKFYWRGVVSSALLLLQLVLNQELPSQEMDTAKSHIQQATRLLRSCSFTGRDEHVRAARMIEIISEDGVHEIFHSRKGRVDSRLGASLMYELCYAAILWKKALTTNKDWCTSQGIKVAADTSKDEVSFLDVQSLSSTQNNATPVFPVATSDGPNNHQLLLGQVGYTNHFPDSDSRMFDEVCLTCNPFLEGADPC